jgi:hypothetical protein
VGDRIGATTSALFSHPTRGNAPSLGEFIGRQDLEEKTIGRGVLCSDLCSSVFHIFSINDLRYTAVRRTAVMHSIRASPFKGPDFGT